MRIFKAALTVTLIFLVLDLLAWGCGLQYLQ